PAPRRGNMAATGAGAGRIESLGDATREVNAAIEEMRREHDTLGSRINLRRGAVRLFCSTAVRQARESGPRHNGKQLARQADYTELLPLILRKNSGREKFPLDPRYR